MIVKTLTLDGFRNYTHFETKAVWWAQILKLLVGLIPVLLIKTFLKTPLQSLVGDPYVADGIRYFLLTTFAGAVWPITFRFWNKLGNKS